MDFKVDSYDQGKVLQEMWDDIKKIKHRIMEHDIEIAAMQNFIDDIDEEVEKLLTKDV